ncbi:MAG: VCBS repeat-containing protein [Planctomycetota bacterium]
MIVGRQIWNLPSRMRDALCAARFFVLAIVAIYAAEVSEVAASCDSPSSLYETGTTIPGAAGGAISTAAADLNLDGVPEIVTVATSNSSDPHFRIHSLDTNGVWQDFDVLSPTEVANNRPNRFGGDSIILDLNNDDYPDILIPESPNGAGAAQLSWFENPGSQQLVGNWTEHVVGSWDGSAGADQPAHMSEVYAGDMDGDSDVDLVTRDVNNGLHILIGDGQGMFDRHFLPVNPREGLSLFDPDNDGDLDILINGIWLEAPDPGDGATQWADLTDVESFVQHPLGVQPTSGLPWYPSVNDASTQSNYASKVLAVDLNADGREDVVITNSEELNDNSVDAKPKGLTIYLAEDDFGTAWTPLDVLTEGRQLHTLDAGDLDFDGDVDLVTGVSRVGEGDETPEVFALLNEGDGTSWSKVPIDDVPIYSGVLADFDGDGDSDIVGPDNWRSGALRLFESNATALAQSAAGDYNCDNAVNQLDLGAWHQSYGALVDLPMTDADGDGSGIVDGSDFLLWQVKQSNQFALLAPSVPEPSTAGLGCTVVVFLFLNWRIDL